MICAMCTNPHSVCSGETIKLDAHTSLTCGTQCSENHVLSSFPGVYTVQWSAVVTAENAGEVSIEAFNGDEPIIGSVASETVASGKKRTLSTAPVPVVFRYADDYISLSLRNTGCKVTVSNAVLFLRKVY